LREAQRMVRDPLAAEEVVQEALLRAWRMRGECRRPEAPEGWLVQITRNEALRRLGRDRTRAEREIPSGDEGPDQATAGEPEGRLEVLDLHRALREVSTAERALLVLRYGCDLPQTDIARALEMPETTVRVRLHRARKRIKRAMETAA
jgi:RNA polymerase sigma-70 factor (ECF subfamily)